MELPRYTRPLRVYTSLAPERQLKSTDELANIYLGKSKEEKKGKTWKVITTYISKDVQSDAACAKALQNLWKQTQDIIGDDQPARIVDDGAVFLLRMFLDEEMVLLKHLSRIRQTFGKVTSATANKICETVKEIGSYLSDDSRAFIENDEPDKPSSHAAIAVGNIKVEKYTRTGTNLLHNMYKKPDKSKGFIDFSFTYKKSETTTDKGASGSGKTTIDSKFGKSWLDAEVKKYYGSGTSREPSEVDVTDSIMALLRSPMSNDELQNELFDLLGIDKFEFIQLLFQHRTDIIGSLNKSNIPEMMASTSRNLSQPLSQVTIQSEAEKLQLKLRRKEAKRLAKSLKNHADDSEDDEDISPAVLRAKRQAQLLAPANNYLTMPSNPERVLVTKITKVRYPYVYDSQQEARERPGFIYGMKMMLPEGVERKDNKIFEEVRIPISEPAPTEIGKNLIAVSTLDEVGQLAFQGTKNLNRIQSVVFNAAYTTNENLLICAPTGAGKTNIAMLTVVHQIRQHIENNIIQRDKFKIVYVAPMKALASEMTANFGKRLQSLGVVVKELTGDMQLTKTEILQTQMLVTTPEKWDVVTRKGSGDEALIRKLRLLILDEVHLLHGDRGPVIEALVARTLRQVESSQSMIRIVGLSATLPNYLDVARFLKVNPMKGLFYFDSRFRPVPLSQIFIGVKASKSLQQMNDMDMICYDKAIEMVQKGHQVMVFVHARNATSRTALVLREMAQQKGQTQLFEPDETPALLNAKKGFSKAKNKQLTELFLSGFACHHAGMLRADRNLVEKYFSEGFIKVLVCTSTLAWGVNLPAHAVIIKGTEIYDQNRGSFVDLGILDVLQIFGRAGRPQFDKSGTGIIVTTFDKLSHYLSLLTNQFPIESNFISLMVDNLNAEIALGTITNIDEAIEWLSYTYLFVRMRLNPQVYGLTMDDVKSDPTLDTKRRELIRTAAMALDKAQMIRFNERTGDLSITDLGRTASHYYIKYDTVEVFNSKMKPIMEEGDILSMVSNAQEFQQLKVRDEELEELDELTHDNCEVSVLGGSENLHGKVNILMQTFLSRGYVKSFSLQSDLSYINQNAARLTRALFEIVLRKNNPVMAGRFLIMSKMFELQQWDFESPIRQFNCIPNDVLQKIQQKRLGIETLREMDKKELGELLRNQKIALLVKRCADEFPLLDMDASLHPITRTVLRIKLQVSANFRWNDKYHGKSESFWIWIEDPDNNFMYHSEYFQITKKQVVTGEVQELVITIPLIEPLPPQYYVRATSDRWLGSQTYLPLTFHHLILPESHPPHTDLLELQPLPVTALDEPSFEMLYNFSHFNPIQTQIFHCLYHTDNNVLLGAPTGSGKTIAAEIAMFRVFRRYPQRKVVYIAPLKALVRERIKDWKIRFEQRLKKKVVELTGDVTPDVRAIKEAHVIVTTPEKWDGISRSWQNRNYVKDVALIVIDEIHLLGEDRGPVLEVIVSRTNFISSDTSRKVRIIGLSTALANAVDLGNWLGIKDVGLYNFRPSVRPVPLEVHISGHAGKHYCPRMMSMNKPTFQAIRQHSPSSPSLVFVSSRRQTRLTALDLISYLAAEDNPKQWLHTGEEEMEQILMNIKDSNLKLTLAFGIGIHHAGLQDRDRKTTEELFVNQKIQVLICTATLAWGVNFPAHLVVIKGTEYYDGKQKRYVDMPITDVLQMMGRAGRPQFDVTGVAVVLVHDVKKNFYKKFLYEPFPVESCLLDVLPDHINAEIAAGTVHTKQQIMDYMTWTYFFRRLLNNPTYYKLETLDPLDINYYLSSLVEDAIKTLEDAGCIAVDEDNKIYATSYGTIASYYYLSHKTMLHFNNNMRFDQTFEELLRVLSDSYEYSLLPVRHNEDILNGELAQLCRLPVDPLTLDSSHTKTFLLFQAHFTNLQLPSTDYLTDLKSVMDNSIRVLQAMIDTSAECGFLATVLQCQQLMQAVIQASWPSESPLLSLPHVEIHHLHLFSRMAKITGKPCMIPAGLKAACWKNYEALASVLREDFEESQIEKIHQVIRDWPTLKIKMGIRGLLPHSPNNEEVTKQFEQPMPRDVWIAVHAEQEYTLDLDITRFGGKASSVHCPRFPKGKDEGWFITLGYMESRELIALKRATIRGRSTKQSVTFVAPTTFGPVILTVFLMSDCYLGMDQQYNIQLDVQAPANYVQ